MKLAVKLTILAAPAILASCSGTVRKRDLPGRFADSPAGKVYYRNWGVGKTAVVFVHGWSSDNNVWKYQIPPIAQKIRVLAVDLIGHGESTAPKVNYTFDLLAESIDAAMRDAGVERAILVGHSNGMPTIRQFYRKYPNKTLALIGIDGTLRPFFKSADELKPFLDMFRGADYQEKAKEFLSSMKSPLLNDSDWNNLTEMVLRTPQHVMIGGLEANSDMDIWKKDPIRVPLLLILAKQPAWEGDYEQYVRDLSPDAKIMIHPGVGHFLQMEIRSDVNREILQFLEENKLLR